MSKEQFGEGPPGQPVLIGSALHQTEGAALSQIDIVRERIYHEDNLLGTRSYNFLTAQAFLVTALATTISGQIPRHQRLITLLIGTLGLCIGLVHGLVTARTLASIRFWRGKLKELEEKAAIPAWIDFDANLKDLEYRGFVSVLLHPFRIGNINRLLSWIVPVLLCGFWTSALVWICCSIW
jgi:hypothetical protein